jgi:hypothetical protein
MAEALTRPWAVRRSNGGPRPHIHFAKLPGGRGQGEAMRTGLIGVAAVGCAILGMAGCGTTTQGSSAPTAPPAAASTPKPAVTVDPLGLTALGALKTVWTAGHQVDPNQPNKYLPLPPGGGGTWFGVNFAKGPGNRVYSYEFDASRAMPASAMQADIRQQLPPDAVILGEKVNNAHPQAGKQCDVIVYQSALLGRADITDPDIGSTDTQGYAVALFVSSGTSNGSYDANQVDTALVNLVGPGGSS